MKSTRLIRRNAQKWQTDASTSIRGNNRAVPEDPVQSEATFMGQHQQPASLAAGVSAKDSNPPLPTPPSDLHGYEHISPVYENPGPSLRDAVPWGGEVSDDLFVRRHEITDREGLRALLPETPGAPPPKPPRGRPRVPAHAIQPATPTMADYAASPLSDLAHEPQAPTCLEGQIASSMPAAAPEEIARAGRVTAIDGSRRARLIDGILYE